MEIARKCFGLSCSQSIRAVSRGLAGATVGVDIILPEVGLCTRTSHSSGVARFPKLVPNSAQSSLRTITASP